MMNVKITRAPAGRHSSFGWKMNPMRGNGCGHPEIRSMTEIAGK
jgi:hypothetical protein